MDRDGHEQVGGDVEDAALGRCQDALQCGGEPAVAVNAFFAATRNASFPLAMDFARGEIDARLALPVAWGWLAVERVLAAAARGVLTAVLMVPLGAVMLAGLGWAELANGRYRPGRGRRRAGRPVRGRPRCLHRGRRARRHIGIAFAVVMPPLLLTGAAQFPFPQLTVVPWFAGVCALNPMAYVSEGLRGLLTPAVAHLHPGLCVGVLSAATVLLTAGAVVTFRRRAAL